MPAGRVSVVVRRPKAAGWSAAAKTRPRENAVVSVCQVFSDIGTRLISPFDFNRCQRSDGRRDCLLATHWTDMSNYC